MKSYPIDQSIFYRLRNRRKLAKALGSKLAVIEAFAKAGAEAYDIYPLIREGKKERLVERPKVDLRRIQKIISSHLGRITPPAYLHSAYKKRSYITNAKAHLDYTKPTSKIDIAKFVPSADYWRVGQVFKDQFQCSPDVAAVLMKMTTVNGHIPTGGNSSTIISFWAYKPMFDEIHALAQSKDLVMTCCVDDMTFTGNKANKTFINEVRLIARRYGLKCHKECHFSANETKFITGVAITPKGPRLPNKRRGQLHEAFKQVRAEQKPKEKLKLALSLLGRATEAEQVEPSFHQDVKNAAKILNEAACLAQKINP